MSAKSIKILSALILTSFVTGWSVQAQELSTSSTTVPVASTVLASSSASATSTTGQSQAVSSSSLTTPASSLADQSVTLVLKKPEVRDQTAMIKGQFSQPLTKAQTLKLQIFKQGVKQADFALTQTVKPGQTQVEFPVLKLQGLSAGTYQVKVLNGQDQVLGQVDLVLPGSVQALESRTSQASEVSSSTASTAPSSSQLDSKLSIRLTTPEIKVKNLVLKGQLEQPLTAPTSLILTILDAKGQATGLTQTLDLAKDAKAFVFSELALDGLAEGDYQLQVTDTAGQVLAKEKLTNLSSSVSSSAQSKPSQTTSSTSSPSSSLGTSKQSSPSSLVSGTFASRQTSTKPVAEETEPSLSEQVVDQFQDDDADLSDAAVESDTADEGEQAQQKPSAGYAIVRPNGQVVYSRTGGGYTADNAGKKVIVRPQAVVSSSRGRLPQTGQQQAFGMTFLGLLLAALIWIARFTPRNIWDK